MKQFSVKDYNRVCAEFLGYEISENEECFKIPNKNGWVNLSIFHTDWNSIMEVVEKINSINLFENPSDTTLLTIREEMGAYLGLSNKEAVVNSIWEFLNWYKTQTP